MMVSNPRLFEGPPPMLNQGIKSQTSMLAEQYKQQGMQTIVLPALASILKGAYNLILYGGRTWSAQSLCWFTQLVSLPLASCSLGFLYQHNCPRCQPPQGARVCPEAQPAGDHIRQARLSKPSTSK